MTRQQPRTGLVAVGMRSHVPSAAAYPSMVECGRFRFVEQFSASFHPYLLARVWELRRPYHGDLLVILAYHDRDGGGAA